MAQIPELNEVIYRLNGTMLKKIGPALERIATELEKKNAKITD